jgi:hypothetical protein
VVQGQVLPAPFRALSLSVLSLCNIRVPLRRHQSSRELMLIEQTNFFIIVTSHIMRYNSFSCLYDSNLEYICGASNSAVHKHHINVLKYITHLFQDLYMLRTKYEHLRKHGPFLIRIYLLSDATLKERFPTVSEQLIYLFVAT